MLRTNPGHCPARWTLLAAFFALAACGSGGGQTLGSGVDTTPPAAGSVNDGSGADIDEQTSTTEISANWQGFTDDSGTIASYSWAIGTTPGGTELQDWLTVGNATAGTNGSLGLSGDMTCFVAVVAYDAAGNVSQPAVSDGVTVTSGGSGNGNGNGGNGGSGSATLASSVSQWGITWRFDRPMPVGRFCNGDWWVLGPVSIVEISPPSQTVSGRTINGSMINPDTSGYHGYDSDLFAPYQNGRYHSSLNVALGIGNNTPLELPSSTSLVSTIGQIGPSHNGSFSQLETAAVLTVLQSEPAADAFRPAYTGSNKTVWFREADLDYQRLASVAPVGSPPDFAATATMFERVWLDHMSGWTSRYMHPVDNMMDYSRDFCADYGTGALLAQLDAPAAQKRDLVVGLTQIGIDFYANVTNGAVWWGEGGQGSGRKFPILFAGAVLDNAVLLSVGQTHPSGYYGPSHPNNSSQFGEDCQTFVVQETSPGIYNWGFGNYNATHLGLPEWGNGHTHLTYHDDSDWMHDPYRRCCTANAWVGQTLAARMMTLQSSWNHPAYFDYMDRFMQIEQPGQWTRCWEPWHEQMWDAYRSQL